MDRHSDWQRASAILEAALDVPEDRRVAFVREACAGDVDLLAELVGLLAAHAKSGGFLDGSALELGSGTRSVATPGGSAAGAAPAPRFAAGQIVGRYRIDRLLGRGGMGEVYAADEIEHGRRVALKVLSGDLSSPEDRDRFLREGRLASAINHPHSVYVFGSDIIEGHPVIVMELLAGGTLKDRVREAGRLPAAEAVDAILQVIAGLEAAHAGGIVHRDVKPGNCFVAPDGTVKIGDFGLSVTTSAQLTQYVTAGTIRVTPQFAAPEQLKGAAPEVRADIYSVGATLFDLLTGQPPFDEADLLALITRVVTDPPPSPRVVVPTVPRGLAAVVVRCLAKDPGDRFQTYADLRTALLPFRSGEAQAASPGARIGAMAVDQMLVTLLTSIVNTLLLVLRTPPFLAPALPLVPFVWSLTAYFLVTEGLGSASIGKRLLGLRVVEEGGGRPGLVQVSVRTAIYAGAAVLPFLVPLDFWARLVAGELPPPPGRVALLGPLSALVSIVGRFVPLLLFVTARNENGWTGIHDLVSGTRVRRVVADAPGLPAGMSPPVSVARPTTRPGSSSRRGPFVLGAAQALADGSTLWDAFDPVLERDVWIRDVPAGAAVASVARRELARPGRLRWLAGQSGPPSWDAFDAPRGAPLSVVAARRWPWKVVREWIADLSRAVAECEASGEAVTLTLDRVWITAGGRAMLLDFPAPGTALADGRAAAPERRAQQLLWEVVRTALEGRVVAVDGQERVEPPLPPAGTALVNALQTPEPVRAGELLRLSSRTLPGATVVRGWSRVVPGVLLFVPILPIVILSVALSSVVNVPLTIGVGSSDLPMLNTLVAIDALDRAGVGPEDPRRRALEVYVARRHEGLATRARSFGLLLAPYRSLAEAIGRRHASGSMSELESAVARIGRDELDALNLEPRISPALSLLLMPAIVAPFIAAFGAAFIVMAFVLRGGLLLTLLRLVVVDAAGTRVTRLRASLRALVAWAPAFALMAVRYPMIRAAAAGDVDGWLVAGILLAIVTVITIVLAIAVPARGLPERLTGTWIVPA